MALAVTGPDAAEVLAYVASALGEERRRAHINGATWTVRMEALWLLVTGRQRPSKLASGAASGDAADVLVLSYEDVAARLGRSRSTVERLARSGELPTVLLGGRPCVRPADLEAYVAGLPVHNGKHEDSHTADGGMPTPLRPASAGGVEQRAGLAGGSGSAHPAGPAHNEGEAA